MAVRETPKTKRNVPVALAGALVLLGPWIRSQERAGTTPSEGAAVDPLFRGWVRELLDGDLEAAARDHAEAAKAAEGPFSRIARARLAEITRLLGRLDEAREHVASLRPSAAERRLLQTWLRDPIGSYRDLPTLPDGETRRARTEALRNHLARLGRSLETRPFVAWLLEREGRRDERGVEARVARLKAELARARQQGRADAARRIRAELEALVLAPQRLLLSQLRRMGVQIAELRLAGRDREADRLEELFYRRYSRATGIPVRRLRQPRRTSESAARTLQRVFGRIDALARSANARERETLQRLRARLEQLRERAGEDAALDLARGVPLLRVPRQNR